MAALKLCSSFFSRQLISRTDSWTPPPKKKKLGTIAHQHLVSQIVLGIFEIRSPFLLLPFKKKKKKKKKRSILRTWNVWSHNYLKGETKSQKSSAPFRRPRLPLRASKLKRVSMMFSNWLRSVRRQAPSFSNFSEILQEMPNLIWVAYQTAFKERESKSVHKRLKSPLGLTVILQLFGVVLFSVFSVVKGFTEIKKKLKSEKCI